MNLPVLYVKQKDILPDNVQWINRFEIKSESSGRIYIIAQHKTNKHWGCSCPGWKRHRCCKHLETLQLPNYAKPHEVKMESR